MSVLSALYLYVRETHADDEVTGPVAEAGECDGCRSRPLTEQFSHYEPWDWTWSDFKEAHEQKNGRHAQVTHPGVRVLESANIRKDNKPISTHCRKVVEAAI